MDTTLRQWFDRFTEQTGETPTHIVLNTCHPYMLFSNAKWPIDSDSRKVMTFENVGPDIMDRQFNPGYGGNESPNLCAWSDNWVIFSDNYDGSEELCWVPRNPMDHEPIRPGGG